MRSHVSLVVTSISHREYYDNPVHAKVLQPPDQPFHTSFSLVHLGLVSPSFTTLQDLGDIDISKYVASGIVVFDLRTRDIKWSQHLDLSTDSTSFKAYAYATPT